MRNNKLKGAGALIVTKSTKRYLLGLRSNDTSYPLTWGMFGGKLNHYETISEGLTRELSEEITILPNIIKIIPFNIYTTNDNKFEYYSYLIIVEDEFIPELNDEHVGYCWVSSSMWSTLKLHPAVRKTLNNKLLIKSFNDLLNKI